MTFGNRVREARKQARLSQEALARIARMSLPGVAKIEQGGVSDPHYSTLGKLAGALNVSVGELMGEPPAPSPPPSRTRAHASSVPSYAAHLENVAAARKKQAKSQDGSFPTSWEAAIDFEDKFSQEALSLMNAAEIAAEDATAEELQSLEAAYDQLGAARRAIGRRVGEVLDSHLGQLKEAKAGEMARRRQERERAQYQREVEFLEHQEKLHRSA